MRGAPDRRRQPLVTRSRWLVAMALALVLACVGAWSGSRWRSAPPEGNVETLPGIDLRVLSDRQRRDLVAIAERGPCPCGCGFTLADCRHKDPTCPRSGPILDGYVAAIAQGRTP